MEFRVSLTPPPSHHHRGERLIRNFGARVPRGNVLFGFPRATISFPPMQACQRRTIGGGGGSGGGDGDRGVVRSAPVAPTAPCVPLPPLRHAALSDHPTHPLRMGLIPFSVRRDCTARGRYWGAYGSARGCTTHSLPPLSVYPFPLPFAYLPFYRSYVRIPSVSAFPVPSAQALHRPRSLFLFSITRPPLILILRSEYGEIRGARFTDQGDLRNSAVEELPISDMRANAYTLASRDLCVCMRDNSTV